MFTSPLPPRLPRAGIDPIDTDAAIDLLATTIHRPFRNETVVILLDDARRGLAVVVVDGTSRPDDVLEVVEFVTHPAAHDGHAGAAIVASVRPGTPPAGGDGVDQLGDVDRWFDLVDCADMRGVELLDWLVISGTSQHPVIGRPRDRLCEVPGRRARSPGVGRG